MSADLSIPFTIVNDTLSDATKVTGNFQAIEDWLNANAVHLDGTKQFTGHVSGVASDPTQDNHLTRKLFVDNSIATAKAAAEATAAADATTKANNAISTAAADATTKANAAETNAKAYAAALSHIETTTASDVTGSSLSLTGVYQSLGLTATLNPTKTSGVAIVSVTVDVNAESTGGVAEFRLKVDGVENADHMIWRPTTDGRVTLSKTWVLPFSGSSETYTVEGTETGGNFSTSAGNTTITAAFIG